MTKLIITYILFLICNIGLSQSNDNLIDWNNPDYSYAKVYLYGLETLDGRLIVENDSLNETVYDSEGVELSQAQAKKVIGVITGENTGTFDEQAMCFLPHHGIVFYDSKDRPIGHVSICISCGNKIVHPETISNDKGMNILTEVIRELNQPVFRQTKEYQEYSRNKNK